MAITRITQRDKIIEKLQELLADGRAHYSRDIRDALEAEGFRSAHIGRVIRASNIVISYVPGTTRTVWSLPAGKLVMDE